MDAFTPIAKIQLRKDKGGLMGLGHNGLQNDRLFRRVMSLGQVSPNLKKISGFLGIDSTATLILPVSIALLRQYDAAAILTAISVTL